MYICGSKRTQSTHKKRPITQSPRLYPKFPILTKVMVNSDRYEWSGANTMKTQPQDKQPAGFKIAVDAEGDERRQHRRHDLEQQGIAVDRWDGAKRASKEFGRIVDLSAGGIRIR